MVCLVLLISMAALSQSNYYNGFDVGFKEGYCYLKVGCIAPNAPNPPNPGVSEDINSYKDGYNRGFAIGCAVQQSAKSNQQRQQYKTATPENIDYMYKIDYNDRELLTKYYSYAKDNAILNLNNKDYPALIDICSKALQVFPNDDNFMAFLGEGYRQVGDYKKAIHYLKKSYRINRREDILRLINGLQDGTFK